MDTENILLKCLKAKRIINDIEKARIETFSTSLKLRKDDDLFIRDAITGYGSILKEELDNHYYITSVKINTIGSVLTYAIIQRKDELAEISVYAHEGLIKQHLSDKTFALLNKILS